MITNAITEIQIQIINLSESTFKAYLGYYQTVNEKQ